MKSTEWLLIDTETSGLGKPIYCVELGAQRMKGLSPDGPAFRALLNHDVDIERQAEAMHGYSRSFLKANGRDPRTIHTEFIEYAGCRPIVAFNLSFDWARVLEPETERLGLSPKYNPGFCALTLARRCVYETDSHKLERLRLHFFPYERTDAHHVLGDIHVTKKLLIEVIWPRLEQAGIESFSDVAAFSRTTPVKHCVDRIRSSSTQRANYSAHSSANTALDPESELFGLIEGMLADDEIVDAEVWTLRHWLEAHRVHNSSLAMRARGLVEVAFEDGKLSEWELDEIKVRLAQLIHQPKPSSP